MTESGQACGDLGSPRACLDGYMGSVRTGATPFSSLSGTAVPPRRSTARPVALCCAVTPAGSCSGRDQDCVEGILRAGGIGGIVAVGLGQVAEASVASHDGDGHVGQAGEIARQMAHVRPATVFVVGEVAHIVEPVLDVPVVRTRASSSSGPARSAPSEVRLQVTSTLRLPVLRISRSRSMRIAWRRPWRFA